MSARGLVVLGYFMVVFGSSAKAGVELQIRQANGTREAVSSTKAGPSMVSRGDGEIHAGIPECDDGGECDTAVTINGFSNPCPAAGGLGWASLAYPVQTDGATVYAVNMVHLNNPSGGHLYLLGDCGGNPEVNDILYTGCGDIAAGKVGVQLYPIDPPVVAGATLWVVAVFSADGSFDVAYNDDTVPTTGLGFANFTDPGGSCGAWEDLFDFGLGYCHCVSVRTLPLPPCCTGDFPALCAGDANGDGMVDPLDVGYALSRLGLDVTLPGACPADQNCDGEIDPLDAGYILARLGSCGPVEHCAVGGGVCLP